ncbi:hypothetical protein FRACA_1770005 [Frankia canadensis]|uniref:Uncharacterized protein n=1 Tax=Frankia canadensis TaxID=1836972 RepID=A0A2I2KNG2_9ACTN|nr:hypothetical protein FRACA_1770005 [Frankia canadensis]SOU54493.1 hypothetical protein FRACA_1770005 [Frankia canadensis]
MLPDPSTPTPTGEGESAAGCEELPSLPIRVPGEALTRRRQRHGRGDVAGAPTVADTLVPWLLSTGRERSES